MSSVTVIAVVGVFGTLASAIVIQLFSQRSRHQEREDAERRRLAEQETAEKQRKTDQLRSCYVQLNANDRNYRDAMLAYAYALKAGSPGEAEAAEVATARRAQRDARAEAQMIVSEEVLDTEGRSTPGSLWPIAACSRSSARAMRAFARLSWKRSSNSWTGSSSCCPAQE